MKIGVRRGRQFSTTVTALNRILNNCLSVAPCEGKEKGRSPASAQRAELILSGFGVKKVVARIVTCAPRQKVKTWIKLERAMLLSFRAEFGSVPVCNSHGKQMKETDEYEYFARDAVRNLVRDLG